MQRPIPLALLALLLAPTATAAPAAGTILKYYVDGSVPSPNNSGTSWGTAFKYVQDALDNAETILLGGCGCEIEIYVRAGTYRPDQDRFNESGSNDRSRSFEPLEEVRMYGHCAGTESNPDERDLLNPANATILTGDIGAQGVATDNSYHVIDLTSSGSNDLASECVVDGFTIEAGYANGTSASQRSGGAIYTEFGRGTITNSVLRSNHSSSGGGAVWTTGFGRVSIANSRITGNTTAGSGAALYVQSDSGLVLTQCLVYGNQADGFAGGVGVQANSVLDLNHCTFADNTGSNGGADLFLLSNADVLAINSIFWSADPIINIQSFLEFDHADVRGGTAGLGGTVVTTNVIDADPLFRDPTNGDYSIAMSSTCVDAGNTARMAQDVGDIDGDRDSTEPLPLDLAHGGRVVGLVDLGATEARCMVTPYCIGVDNSTGSGARIAAFGSCSVAAQDLTLAASPVPNSAGLFYFGTSQVQMVFGDGIRCAAGVTHRLPVVLGVGNRMTFTLDWNSPPAQFLLPNSTWNFQLWYRDPMGGPTGFNFSDAVEIDFEP